jgi:uncharacterized protein YjeT (DUF2065 family)
MKISAEWLTQLLAAAAELNGNTLFTAEIRILFAMNRRLLELLGMLMIGDGLLSVVDPKRHCLLWEIGPDWCREMVDEFAEHPNAARGAGLVELVLGVLLASRQEPTLTERFSGR